VAQARLKFNAPDAASGPPRLAGRSGGVPFLLDEMGGGGLYYKTGVGLTFFPYLTSRAFDLWKQTATDVIFMETRMILATP